MGTAGLAGDGAAAERRAEARALLSGTEGLRVTARAQVRGSWVPMLVFGVLTLAASPFARYAFNFGASGRSVTSYPAFAYAELTGLCVVHTPSGPCVRGEFDGSVLRFAEWGVWFAVLPLAWIVLARWFRRRGETRGIVPRRAAWIGAMAGTAVVVALAVFVLQFLRNQPFEASLLENAYASPWYLVGAGLLTLGLVERDWITSLAGCTHMLLLSCYLAAPWGSGWTPWNHPAAPGWVDGPQAKALLLAGVLLLAGLAQRMTVHRRTTAGPVGPTMVSP